MDLNHKLLIKNKKYMGFEWSLVTRRKLYFILNKQKCNINKGILISDDLHTEYVFYTEDLMGVSLAMKSYIHLI